MAEPASAPRLVVGGEGFTGWHALNDTVMGGRSSGTCRATNRGLELDAEVVEQGGGFVSVRSPRLSPPLDLSGFGALRLELVGDGRRYKLALACGGGLADVSEMIPGGLRWVAEFSTQPGPTRVEIPFERLRPSIRARPLSSLPLGLPLRFEPGRITRIQILHSRFGDDGGPNPGFRPGPLHLELRSIEAVP